MTQRPGYILLIIALLLYGCNRRADKALSVIQSQQNTLFQDYLNRFEKINLPLAINGCGSWRGKEYTYLDPDTFSEFTDGSSMAYVQIPTNGDYVATITLTRGECLIPILNTYTRTGKLLDRATIFNRGCGSDCGLLTCITTATINSDYTLYAADTLSYYECDSVARELAGSYQYYRMYHTGKLKPDGKIEWSDEITEDFNFRRPGN